MNKSILISCVLAVGLAGTLYSLPKVVVNNKAGEMETQESTAAEEPASSAAAAPNSHDGAKLSAEQQAIVDQLRNSFQKAVDQEKALAGIKLSDQFRGLQKFDSAAYYAEQASLIAPGVENHMRTGDRYYDAYGFAVDEQKAKNLGQKTREYYKKALDLNPGLLTAKANMAMTYVNTPNPMQGIMMLREVLDNDPTNELALFNLGILSMRSNQYAKATDRFRQILTNNPSNTKAKFYLGLSLVELGKNDEARKVLSEVKKEEKDPIIQQAIAELEGRLNQ
ncbi:tetratricopeptide repeat protein [Dyadobacter tibetensis]|uniref:tetratricopeptide repeat protein n=1 Tax=Dyadobacter tibetensis TaxID=1211851 RepID=UPI000470F0E6|nr:tetratricopeptide repeat protein [Dyadobacter tibetensis]